MLHRSVQCVWLLGFIGSPLLCAVGSGVGEASASPAPEQGRLCLALCCRQHRISAWDLTPKPTPTPTCRCGNHFQHKDTISGLRSTRLHEMAEAVGKWWQQGCWRWTGISLGMSGHQSPSTKLSLTPGRSCCLQAPCLWLGAISRLVPANYRAPGSLPYLGFCRSRGLKLSRSLGKPFPLLK